ncbi:MAG: RNA repair transcriptional activator RtcR [Planctomycetota bacterium]|nr:RNA repair transcriptional activator RtcR [Planctomycetota bacterium]
MAKKRVIIGLLGTTIDAGVAASRWETWRPTVSLCQHEDLLVDRFELLSQQKFAALRKTIEADIATVSPETKVRHHPIEFDDAWDFESVYAALHDFAAGYPFEPEREDYYLHITTGTHVAQICLFLLAESRHIPARLIQTSPPTRSRHQDAGGYRVIDLDLSKYDRIAQRFDQERREGQSYLKAGIDTKNAAFNRLMERIEHVALHSRDPILLTGPTGAGKSKLARRIYELKKQRRQVSGKFIELNCATLRGDAAMSALFGHKKGAFTGAVSDRPGLLREADGGLLMLDEVAELGSDEQAMLLRAIEDKVFLPLGSDKEARSDFQLICGTNRDLREAVRAGEFREDLLARINLWLFRLPGLAERREDIEPNVAFELAQIAARTGAQVRFNHEAAARFRSFALSDEAAWSGNFRDLSAAITRMATLTVGGRITAEIVDDEVARLRAGWSAKSPGGDDDQVLAAALGRKAGEIDLFDRVQLAAVIRLCRASQSLSDAGRALFAVSRQKRSVANDADRLRKYLARFGLDWDQIAADAGE